jgi:hypothetical protein
MNSKIIMKIIFLFLLCSCCLNWDYLPTNIGEISLAASSDSLRTPNVANLNNGNYVVTWTSVKSNYLADVFYAIYSPTGLKITEPTQVNPSNSRYNSNNFVETDSSNGFAIIWNLKDQASYGGTVNQIMVRYYDSTLTASNPVQINNSSITPGQDEMRPFLTFLTSGKLLAIWNPGYQIISQLMIPGLNLSTYMANINLNNNEAVINYSSTILSLGNGKFVIAWSREVSTYDVWAGIFNDDCSIVKAKWTVNTNLSGGQEYPISTLLSDRFVIAWSNNSLTSGRTNIMAQLYDLSGTSIGVNFNVNTTTNCYTYISVDLLSDDGFIVSYTCSSNSVYYQLFDISGKKVGSERKITDLILTSSGSISRDKGSGFISVYTTGAAIKAKILFRDSGVCSDIIALLSGQSVAIDFNLSEAFWVNITTLPTKGILKTISTDALITVNTLFPLNDLKYTSTTPQPDFFLYSTNLINTSCKATISICYISCFTCSGQGDSIDHKCFDCDVSNGFYPLSTNMANCYDTSTVPSRYVIKNNMWTPCAVGCETCTDTSTDPSDMKCLSCSLGYYPRTDLMTNCYDGDLPGYKLVGDNYKPCYSLCKKCTDTPVDPAIDMLCEKNSCKPGYFPKIDNLTSCFRDIVSGYYFAGSIYQKCYSLCQSCSDYPSNPDIDMNCKLNSCVKGYFPKIDNMTSCFRDAIPGYSFDGTVYQKCYPLCQSCNGYPTEPNIDMLCNSNSCIAGYYPKIDNTTSCFQDDLSGYYFDIASKTYMLCYPSCFTCSAGNDDQDHNCTKCNDGFYPLVDKSTSCFKSDFLPNGYYFDNSMFSKCYNSCKTCSGQGNAITPNCIECADEYPTCTGCSSKTYNGSCVEECPITTIYKEETKECQECLQDQVVFNNNCLTSCPDGYVVDSNVCISCMSKGMYGYKTNCIASCPSNTLLNESINTCEEICQPGVYLKDIGCVSCSSLSKLSYNNQCVDICLDGTQQVGEICQPLLTFEKISCGTTSCQNGGKCQIKLNAIVCQCSSGFSGSLCQYNITSIDLTKVISI